MYLPEPVVIEDIYLGEEWEDQADESVAQLGQDFESMFGEEL